MNTPRQIDNFEGIIDVRLIIARVEELEAESEDCAEADELMHALKADELSLLQGLLGDLKGNGGDEQWRGDWYPLTLIRDSYFVEAMIELCEDLGDLPEAMPKYFVIDWDAVARNLRQDYSSVEFDGITYWYR